MMLLVKYKYRNKQSTVCLLLGTCILYSLANHVLDLWVFFKVVCYFSVLFDEDLN